MESDLLLYLQCLQHPSCCSKQALHETLQGLANLISTHGKLKDAFRENKGLHILLKLLISNKEVTIKQAALFTLSCAIDSCVSSQNVLIQKGVVGLLGKNLKTVYKTSLFGPITLLLSYLAQGNSLGQNKARHAGFITIFIQYLRECFPIDNDSKVIWNSVLTCLSSLVNNPRNSINQQMCMEIVPMCLAALKHNIASLDIVKSVCSFVRLCLSDNDSNQSMFGKIGGLETCLEILSGLKRDAAEAAWCVISLINASPQALLESSAAQLECVPLLLHWITIGSPTDIPNGLHTLALAVETNAQAKAALISHRSGMSSILMCMSIGDEGARKTAQLLMQILFHEPQDVPNTSEPDSDLESASYEIVKQASNKRTPYADNEPFPKRPRSKVVKLSSNWGTTPASSHNTTRSHGKNKAPKLSSTSRTAKTPWLTAAKTPWLTAAKTSRLQTPRFTGYSPSAPITPEPTPNLAGSHNSAPFLTSKKNRVVNTSHHSSRMQDPHWCSVKDSENVVSVVEQKIDQKMIEFFNRFESVLSTNNSIKSDASISRSDKHCQTVISHDMSTRAASESITTDPAPPPPSKEKLYSSSDHIPSRRPPQIFSSGHVPTPNKQPEHSPEDDNTSIITHISQHSLLDKFFFMNPEFLPCMSSDNPTERPYKTQSLSGMRPPPTTSFYEDQDSGFDNVSNVSSAVTVGMSSWPKVNLSQKFFEIPLTPNDQTQRDYPTPKPSIASTLKSPTQSTIFSEQEIANLCKGVQTFGCSWSIILLRFDFHPSRTPTGLKRKFGQIKKFQDDHSTTKTRLWSGAELRRLKRGVLKFGSDWRKILKYYKFRKDMTVSDLCNKWLAIDRIECI